MQARLTEHARSYNARAIPHIDRTRYLLTGLLKCGCCGAFMQISGGSPHRYYRCVSNRKRGVCSNRLSVRESLTRERVLGAISQAVASPKAVAHVRAKLAERLGSQSRDTGVELAERTARLARVEERIRGIILMQVDGGVAHATCDPEVVSYWLRRAPGANIAIACHRLLAVDVDPRNGGDYKMAALLDEHGPFPLTPTQKTGGGGTHHLFRLPALRLRGRLVHGVDLIHGPRRYIVAAPSVVKGGRVYEWLTAPRTPLADAPEWLLSLALRGDACSPGHGTLPTVARSRLVARAAAYLRKVPPAVSGQGGHAHTFMTACRLVRGFLLDADEAYGVMLEWNRACDPPWSERDLRRKIDQALEHGQLPFGALLDAENT